MPWRYAFLRGTRVLARCEQTGALVDSGGRVEIRYTPDAPRAYRAAARNLALDGDEILPDDACAEVGPDEAGEGAKKKRATRSGGRAGKPTAEGAAAGQAARKVTLPDNAIIAYTDGACSGNPGPAGLGVVIGDGDSWRECSRYLGQGTNNIAELTAIAVAAEAVKDPQRPVRIHTDSRYAIGVLTQGWKAKANKALIADVKAALSRLSDVALIHVRGHAGIPLNERADALAVAAVQNRASSDWQAAK